MTLSIEAFSRYQEKQNIEAIKSLIANAEEIANGTLSEEDHSRLEFPQGSITPMEAVRLMHELEYDLAEDGFNPETGLATMRFLTEGKNPLWVVANGFTFKVSIATSQEGADNVETDNPFNQWRVWGYDQEDDITGHWMHLLGSAQVKIGRDSTAEIYDILHNTELLDTQQWTFFSEAMENPESWANTLGVFGYEFQKYDAQPNGMIYLHFAKQGETKPLLMVIDVAALRTGIGYEVTEDAEDTEETTEKDENETA